MTNEEIWIMVDKIGVSLTKVIEKSEYFEKIQDEAIKAKDLCNKLKGELSKKKK
jgi:hypothetical protein